MTSGRNDIYPAKAIKIKKRRRILIADEWKNSIAIFRQLDLLTKIAEGPRPPLINYENKAAGLSPGSCKDAPSHVPFPTSAAGIDAESVYRSYGRTL